MDNVELKVAQLMAEYAQAKADVAAASEALSFTVEQQALEEALGREAYFQIELENLFENNASVRKSFDFLKGALSNWRDY